MFGVLGDRQPYLNRVLIVVPIRGRQLQQRQ